MHPRNVPCLSAAQIDVCALANNHVLDWGYDGLAETLDTLAEARIHAVGAGRNLEQAQAPAIIDVEGKGRVIVLSYGLRTSGIPGAWAAAADKPGVNLLSDLSAQSVHRVQQAVEAVKQAGDVVVFSIHWGGNWGYDMPTEHVTFAHRLIDEAGVDVVHGHSSHHVKGLEVYQGKLVLYGAGDFINDYEGIGGYEAFRPDLALMYFGTVDPATGRLVHLHMMPMQVANMRLNRASDSDARWLGDLLTREGERFGTRIDVGAENVLVLQWD
jgi:poly-gamma-glutamate synthesis protein (capsule biosynthesis protein)